VCGGRRERAAAALSARLFLLSATLRPTLLAIVVECQVALGSRRELLRADKAPAPRSSMFALDPARSYTLPEFVEVQAAQRDRTAAVLATFTSNVRELVRCACNASLESFLALQGIKPGGKMTFQERGALRAICCNLAKFVRMADLLVKDTMLTLAVESVELLARALDPPNPPRATVRYVEDSAARAAEDGGVEALMAKSRSSKASGGAGGGGGG